MNIPMSNRNPKTSIKLSNILNYPWHFALLSLVFMSRGYFFNKRLFAAGEVALYTILSVLGSVIIFLVLKRFLSLHKAGLLTVTYVLLFFNYGAVYDVISFYAITRTARLGVIALYLPYIIGLLALVTLILFKLQKREYTIYATSTTFLNIIALTLVAGVISREINVALTIAPTTHTPSSGEAASSSPEVVLPEQLPEALPDVYYIILDGYPSNDYLAGHWKIDNTAFTSQLEALGFYVAHDSVSNYTFTHASLSSSLYMDYVQNFAPTNATRSGLEPFLLDSYTARIFQAMGYQYIVITSGFFPYSTIADLTIDVAQSGELIYTPQGGEVPDLRRSYLTFLYQATMLRALDPTSSLQPGEVAYWQSHVRTNPQFTALQAVAENDAPTFTFFHLTKPHGPITFDRQGNRFEWTDFYQTQGIYLMNEAVHFEDQIIYINNRIIETVESILQVSAQPPIIIIQGDHGFQLQIARPEFANAPIPILNAYYFPDNDYSNLRQNITPVNSFRILFNQYFGFDYELLAEVSYYQPSDNFNTEWGQLEFEIIPDGEIEPPFRPED